MELFRRSESEGYENDTGKANCESQFEGILLAFLVIIWLPSVVLATTDGAASDFGNTYFFTWGSTVVVIHTFITWLQDWRKSVHEASRQLRSEYDRSRMEANTNTKANMEDEDSLGDIHDVLSQISTSSNENSKAE